MKTNIYIFTFLLTITTFSFGQIITTKVADKADETDISQYDSLKNYIGTKVNKYIGQELYLNLLTESLSKYGYEGFLIDYKSDEKSKSNIYKCCDGNRSKYTDLKGKYFRVLEVLPDNKGSNNRYYFLKLMEKDSKDILYYKYDSQYSSNFPFIVVGYYEKMRNNVIGKTYILRTLDEIYDVRTGKKINFTNGTEWKCVDFTIEDKYYRLVHIFENSLGERIKSGGNKGRVTFWEKETAENYRSKFGDQNWELIVNGKVSIGMTKDMCELSWGKPDKINETITSEITSEQWVFADNTLYFDNGILTAIQ